MTHNQTVFLTASLYLCACFFVSVMCARHGLRRLDTYPAGGVKALVTRVLITVCLLTAGYVAAVFVKLMQDGVNYPR